MKKAAFNIALVIGSVFSLASAHAVVPEAIPDVKFHPYLNGYPDQRPTKAPVAALEHDRAWYTNALTGISKPYPYSMLFLESQGAWYTPFNRPGMPGYYDIRGLHRNTSSR